MAWGTREAAYSGPCSDCGQGGPQERGEGSAELQTGSSSRELGGEVADVLTAHSAARSLPGRGDEQNSRNWSRVLFPASQERVEWLLSRDHRAGR